ncbi:MAG: RNase adaptor protein RapZ [Alphaproteobacteria bacterium 40-19]|nr:MAG: RNase adaptor protein RapZ [Alphaproteobacteria bacterium 40-19]
MFGGLILISPRKTFVITGLSGSGKTLALKLLEDLGCEVVDNIPISLCPLLIKEKDEPGPKPLAIGIDLRTRDFSPQHFKQAIDFLKTHCHVTVLFIEASSTVIAARYRETRRIHPLAPEQYVEDLIQKERTLLKEVRNWANLVFDTSTYSPPEMRCQLQNLLSLKAPIIQIYLISFSFRRGVPQHSDFVFDMRFLANPHYEKNIRFLTGQTQEIQGYLEKDTNFKAFLQSTQDLFVSSIFPQFQKEARGSVILSFGCTGGRHRSVGTAEYLGKYFLKNNWLNKVVHRDL